MNKSALGFAVMALVLVVPAPAFALHGAPHAAQDSAKTAAVDALLAPTAPGSPGIAVAIYRAGTVEYVQGYDLANLEQGTKVTPRSEEHTSELQSLMRISYAVFCLKKKK